jgi:hypothetical protein
MTLVSVKPFDKMEGHSDASQYLTGWQLTLVTISLALGVLIIGVATPGIKT